MEEIKRGDIHLAKLTSSNGSVQDGMRPCIVISNNLCNKYSPTITVIPITSKVPRKDQPTHVSVGVECGLKQQSLALVEQMQTVDKNVLIYKVGKCTDEAMIKLEMATQIQNGVIDLGKINKLIECIKELDSMLSQFKNNIESMSRELLLGELKSYCKQYNINHEDLLYKNYHKKAPTYNYLKAGVV